MKKVIVNLQPLVTNLNLPTVLKTAILPGEAVERLFIATQVGEIYYIGDGVVKPFLDIRQRVIKLGEQNNGYDERGLLGMAFHPQFTSNGLFYLHYSVAGTQGPGALSSFLPNPCDPSTLNLKWINRETLYDHIDTVEEWVLQSNGQPRYRRTLLNIRRPFMNHNGIHSLNFSPETGQLVLITGDGGSGYDPFNLSQDNLEIAGKIIEIDINKNTNIYNPPIVTRFNELPAPIQDTLTVIAKGVRNSTGIHYQKSNDHYIKYLGNVGQDLSEAIYSFTNCKPVPVTQLSKMNNEGMINFGWRGWEGYFPTMIIKSCPTNSSLDEKTIAYYDEAVKTSTDRLLPLVSYYHEDPRPDHFSGNALTAVQPYMGKSISDLTDSIVFTDFVRTTENNQPAKGVLAYTRNRTDCKLNDYGMIEVDYNYGSQSAYYVSLGSNLEQTKLYLGVYGSTKVADRNQGTVFEIVP